ncbi:MAG: DJ-1/PfpI family protein [Bacteriovoracaceae bacterium]|nr:DJ-1/PfpI family protein [Bacteriovoracaceae bacterium]
MKNVVVMFANGFEEIEGITIVDIMRRAGVLCQTVGISSDAATGAHGVCIKLDATLSELNKNGKIDAVILPGGMPGATNLKENRKLIEYLKTVNNEGGIIAAICAAPIALDAADLLHGKNYTCYPGFEKEIKSGRFTSKRVVVDGNIITSNGPGSAMDFSYALLDSLGLSRQSVELREGMLAK